MPPPQAATNKAESPTITVRRIACMLPTVS
jgi:hypothetical protein